VSYAPGDDGYIEAGMEWPAPRFTDNGDGTVTDTLTGLMWLKDGGCMWKSWNSALRAITNFNNNPRKYSCLRYAANYADWRLPNMNELESLVNYGVSNSASWLNSQGFVNMKSSSYWSSTTYRGGTTQAWTVSIYNGTGSMSSKYGTLYVLPVRDAVSGNSQEVSSTGQTVSYAKGDDGYIEAGIEWPTLRFTDNGDGTVTDTITGLMWLKDGGCFKKNWSTMLSTISNFNSYPGQYNCLGYAASYTDWRLPNVKELESFLNYGTSDSSSWLNSQGFVNVKSSYYWSSTTYPGSTTQAWIVDMQKAKKVYITKSYNYYGWPVRGGNAGGN
jgi:hypothetical protein